MLLPVRCPPCQNNHVIQGGTTKVGKQRSRCHNAACPHSSFVLHPASHGHVPEIKAHMIDRARSGNGIRDTARVLKIRPNTVRSARKTKRQCSAG